MFQAQADRIREKLKSCASIDSDFAVFGAASHRYRLNAPLSEARVREFEETYQIELPSCYRTFVTLVGNGGGSYGNAAAGPFYGIYPLAHGVDELMVDHPPVLNEPPPFKENTTQEEWTRLTAFYDDDETEMMSDEIFSMHTQDLYRGILPLGSQGCSSIHALVVSGDEKGRVLNLNLEYGQPHFSYEANFLDWYERWCDEIMAGELQAGGPSWFGYCRGGTEEELFRGYQTSENLQTRLEYLDGLMLKLKLSKRVLETLANDWPQAPPDVQKALLRLLTKFDYTRARPFLRHLYLEDPLAALQFLYWYARSHCHEWTEEIKELLVEGNVSLEMFRFLCYTGEQSGMKLAHLIKPYCEHEDLYVATQAKYTLNQIGK